MKIILSRNLLNALTVSASRVAVATSIVAEEIDGAKAKESLLSKISGIGFNAVSNITEKAVTVTKDADTVTIDVNDNFIEDAADALVKMQTRMLGLVVPLVSISKGYAEDIKELSKKWETPVPYVSPNGKTVTAYCLHEFYTLDAKTVVAIVEDLKTKTTPFSDLAEKYGLARTIIKDIAEEYLGKTERTEASE